MHPTIFEEVLNLPFQSAPGRMFLQVNVPVAQRLVMQENGSFIPAGVSILGEFVEVLGYPDSKSAHIRTILDGYEAYMHLADLVTISTPPTHYICYPFVPVRTGPTAQNPAIATLGMMSPVVVDDTSGVFVHLLNYGWVHRNHVRRRGVYETDMVSVLQQFLGIPYNWGSRREFQDCSSIVQTSWLACNRVVPRTAREQETCVGKQIEPDSGRNTLQRGDYVFWKGHVAVMLDEKSAIHAAETPGHVLVEPLANIIRRRFEMEPAQKQIITSVRRP